MNKFTSEELSSELELDADIKLFEELDAFIEEFEKLFNI